MTTFKALQKLAPVLLAMFAVIGVAASPALAESHPKIGEFSTSSNPNANPNGIAIEEATGDVYVAEIGTNTVSKFTAAGVPITTWGTNGQLTGIPAQSGKPAESFSFPTEGYGTPAAIAVDNSKSSSDPSAGDLYVMDAGHGVIDKFSPEGSYLSQIGGLEGELLGLGVDASGNVRVDTGPGGSGFVAISEFDDSSENQLIATQLNKTSRETAASGVPQAFQEADGFAVGPTGDDYLLYRSCSCAVKLGQQLAGLGQMDGSGSGDVALAVDPATGHVYVDDQSSVAEWDTGAMNGSGRAIREGGTLESAGVLVGERFGSLQLSGLMSQGGIAVNGDSGEIYVANPTDGKVYVFGSDAPAITVGATANVTGETASLTGTVNPRGATVTSCRFEYGVADAFGQGIYEHTASCKPTAAEIGAGTGPVSVSADIEGLKPGLLYRFRLIAGNASGLSESSGLLATVGVGFGVKAFEIAFLNEDGTPDTQAGSHPYEMVTNIEFNSRFLRTESNNDSPYVLEPDGALKDLAVDLPPGLVGDPNATTKKCGLKELAEYVGIGSSHCPPEAFVGYLSVGYSNHIYYGSYILNENVYNVVPPHGVALQLGADYLNPDLFINNDLLAGGDYPVQATIANAPPAAPVLYSRLTIFGVVGSGSTRKAFLTLPTGCHGPLRSTISVDSYEQPGHFAEASSVTRDAAGTPVKLTGCSKLQFPPTITVSPDVPDASTSTGLTVGVNVSQKAAFNPEGLAESALRDTTVTLPEGVVLNPAGADGLEACSSDAGELPEGALGSPGDQIGYKGSEELNAEYEPGVKWNTFTPELASPLVPGSNFCANGSKIGTVKIKTPLLEHEVEGAVYLAAQDSNPFGSLIAMYLIAEDPASGSLIKLAGEVKLTATGQIVTTFMNTPDVPFEDLELHFFGGERAPLSTPSRCGTYTTSAVFTPWDGNGPVTSTSSFQIEHGPNGGPCPGASLPFNPSLAGGATNVNAGAFSPLTLTMSRKDGEQNLQSVEAHLPPGLSGILSNIELCPEPQANLGECPPNSLIGETTISVGVGGDPFSVTGGKFYLTGPYNGSGACTVGSGGCAPFGITFEVPAKAGPFDLRRNSANPAGENACDCVIVRGKIEINPTTAALTVTSDPPGSPYAIPTSIEGIPLEIQHVNAITTRGDFQFNPTNCDKMAVTGTIHSSEGALDTIGVPFQVTNCAALGFKPGFKVSTSGKTSRSKGASLTAKLSYPQAPFGSQANIARVKVDLPKQLPSRLTTLQKACTAAQFNANPAGCPAASFIGHAKAITPILPVALEGPAIFVSHGGEAFPSLVVVLQGYGVTIDLVGSTFISKAGITSSTFKTVPDQPVTSFELTLPEGKYSALAANGNLCASKLTMPTEFVAQNGAKINESTPISVTGCAKKKTLTRAQKLKAALKACHKKKGSKRSSCERTAKNRYGTKKAKHHK